jgi:hypothetical protein
MLSFKHDGGHIVDKKEAPISFPVLLGLLTFARVKLSLQRSNKVDDDSLLGYTAM